jgi:uncharacterized RDD family membrane protein YckC
MPVPTAIGPTGPTATGPTGSPAHALVGQSQLAVLATLAPIEQRLLARLIDFGVLLALNIVINGYFFILFLREIQPALTQAENGDNPFQITYSGRATTLALVIQLVAMALWFAYEVLATANTGQTFGKKVAGVRVVTADGRPLGFRRSILRWLPVGVPVTIGLLAVPILLIDALWCTWDKPRRQCLHDKAAATLVVRAATNSHSGEPPCR